MRLESGYVFDFFSVFGIFLVSDNLIDRSLPVNSQNVMSFLL